MIPYFPQGLLGGGDPSATMMGTAAPAIPPPYAKKPSIADRVAGLLFPADEYSGLLDQGTSGLSRQALMRFGLGLLQQSGPHPQGTTNFGQNLATAYQGVNFPEMAQQAIQLQQYSKQTRALAATAAAHPSIPGETPDQTYGRIAGMIADLAGVPGTEKMVGDLSNALAQLRPREAKRPRYVYKTLHENGQDYIYRVNEDDPEDKIKIGMASPNSGGQVLAYDAEGNAMLVNRGTATARPVPGVAKPLSPLERTAASRVQSAETSVNNIERLAQSNPQALNEAVAALRLSHYGKLGQAAADVRNSFSSPEGQQLYGELSNVLLAVAPTYGGARPTDVLLNLEQATSTPGVGGSKQALSTAIRHMRERLRDIRAQARIPEPDSTQTPDEPPSDSTTTPALPNYNPTFLHPYRKPSRP